MLASQDSKQFLLISAQWEVVDFFLLFLSLSSDLGGARGKCHLTTDVWKNLLAYQSKLREL